MSKEKVIIYFGNDKDFNDKLEEYCNITFNSNFKIINIEYTSNEILEVSIKESPHIVFIDFTTTEYSEAIFEEISFMKKISKFRSILFAGLIENEDSLPRLRHLYSSGFQLTLIKGDELDNFISDSFYIAFGDRLASSQFAKADDMNLNAEIGLCSSITKITAEHFYIETDLSISMGEEQLTFDLGILRDLEATKFNIEKHSCNSSHYPLTDTYMMNFPFAGPWDEVTTETVQKETVETWIDLNKDKLIQKSDAIKIITDNFGIYSSLLESSSKLPLIVDVSNVFNFNTLKDDLLFKKYPLIFIDLNEDTPNDMDSIGELINVLNSIQNYKPILVTLNNPSKAEALQKVYGYKNIVAISKELSIDMFILFINKFIEKADYEKNRLDNLCFKYSDMQRTVDVKTEILLTSLTEHEITFVSNDDLPMFTVLEFNLPVHFFITIIPPFDDLGLSLSGTRYMGLVNGVSEEDKQIIRKFINQIIFKPLTDFTEESVLNVLEQKVEKKEVEVEKKEIEQSNEHKIVIDKSFKRPEIKGRSKL
jgi:hypothetical protein